MRKLLNNKLHFNLWPPHALTWASSLSLIDTPGNGPQRGQTTCPVSSSQDPNPFVSCCKASTLITNATVSCSFVPSNLYPALVPHIFQCHLWLEAWNGQLTKAVFWDDRQLPIVAPAYSKVTVTVSGPLTLPMQADRRTSRGGACKQWWPFLPKATRSPAPIYKSPAAVEPRTRTTEGRGPQTQDGENHSSAKTTLCNRSLSQLHPKLQIALP